MLEFIKRVKNPGNIEAFEKGVIAIGQELGINPNWIMAVMFIESRCNPQAVNSGSHATGLIQFTKKTAENLLNTTVEHIEKLNACQQLPYVKTYLKKQKGKRKINSLIDTYLLVFFPAAIGQSNNYVLQTKDRSAAYYAKLNSGYDLNKDKRITKGEVEQSIMKTLTENGYKGGTGTNSFANSNGVDWASSVYGSDNGSSSIISNTWKRSYDDFNPNIA